MQLAHDRFTVEGRRADTHSHERLVGGVEAARALVDGAAANVIVAAADLEIVYMNGRAEAEVRLIEMLTRERFASVWSEMIEDWIRRLPDGVEARLRDPASESRAAVLRSGDVTLNSYVSGVFDGTSECLGSVVVWHDTAAPQTLITTAYALATAIALVPPSRFGRLVLAEAS